MTDFKERRKNISKLWVNVSNMKMNPMAKELSYSIGDVVQHEKADCIEFFKVIEIQRNEYFDFTVNFVVSTKNVK